MKITSPLLYAVGEIDGVATANSILNLELDFSVRAPFGIMIDRIDLYAHLNPVATTQGVSVFAAVINDPDVPLLANIVPGPGVASAVSQSNLNSDVLAVGWRSYFGTTGVPDVAVRPVQEQVGPIATFDFTGSEPSARPVSVRPMQFAGGIENEGGIAAQTWMAGFHITYQTVELDSGELVGLVASR